MSVAVDIAKDLVSVLAAKNDFSMPFVPVFEPVPRTDIQNVRNLEVFVTPDSVARTRLSRDMWEWNVTVQIGIVKHIDKLNRAAEIEALTTLADEVAVFAADAVLPNVKGANPVSFMNTPLYYFEHVNQFSAFTCVLSLVYKMGVRRGA